MNIPHQGGLNDSVRVPFEARGGAECPSVAFWLTERPGTDSVWRLEVYAHTEGTGMNRLGTVVHSQLGGAPGDCCALMAGCPGADAWVVEATKIAGSAGDGAQFGLSDSPGTTPHGVRAMYGHKLFPSYLERSGTIAAAGTTVTSIPAGEVVTHYSAWQAGDGAQLTIESPTGATPMSAIALPPMGAVSGYPRGSLVGPCTFNWDWSGADDKGGWLVELLR